MSASSDPQRSTQKRRATGRKSTLCDTHELNGLRASQSSMSAVNQKQPPVSAAAIRLTTENGIRQPPESTVAKGPRRQKDSKQPPVTAEATHTGYASKRSTVIETMTGPPQMQSTSFDMQRTVSNAARAPPPLKRLKPASAPALDTTLSPVQRSKRSPAAAVAKAPRPQKRKTGQSVPTDVAIPEKRLKRYRPVPTIAIRERINRVRSQQFSWYNVPTRWTA
ncbi:hypothetical protein MHU86_7665 [Fragilaria crotonensis]|nr:hypothetical protein MHU86_7665 [Fragilaria crotonensis]